MMSWDNRNENSLDQLRFMRVLDCLDLIYPSSVTKIRGNPHGSGRTPLGIEEHLGAIVIRYRAVVAMNAINHSHGIIDVLRAQIGTGNPNLVSLS